MMTSPTTILETTATIEGVGYRINLVRHHNGEVLVTVNGFTGVWDCDPYKVPDGQIVGMGAKWNPHDGGDTERIYDLLDTAIANALRARG